MCTLTVAWQVFPEYPVLAAANRDEAYDRPSEPPEALDSGVIAPRDAEAGGTWIGYGDGGPFVGITNRWVDGLPSDRSRGLLVRDCLDAESAEAAARHVEHAVENTAYDGFNLLVADSSAAILLEWDGQLAVRTLRPGVHVLVNVGLNGELTEPPDRPEVGRNQADNARRLRGTLRPTPGEHPTAWLDRAADALGDHEFGVCVHGDGFGTVSSSLLAIDRDGECSYEFADGPPCETAYRSVSVE